MSSITVPSQKAPSRHLKTVGRGYGWLHWLVFLVLLVGLSLSYVRDGFLQRGDLKTPKFSGLAARHLTVAQETVTDFHPDFSKSFSEPLKRLLPHRTDGVVQPLWPWVVAWLMDAEGNVNPSTEEGRVAAWVRQAHLVQLFWTLGWLVLLGLACARKFTLPAALLVILMVGFQGFLPSVGPFTSEALFQVLFLLTWVACIFSLQRNSLWTYGLVGAMGALAYLAEDRVLPLLLVFVAVSSLRAFWEWLVAHFPSDEGTTLWVPRNHGLGMLLLAAAFFFISGPRLAESYQRFGDPFFTYHDQVRWLDDAVAAEAWAQQHPDTGHIAIPYPWESLQEYRIKHTPKQSWDRFRGGLQGVWEDFSKTGGLSLGLVLGVLCLMFVAMKCATPKATHAGQRLHPEAVPALLFMLLATGTYIAIAAWDAPIAGDEGRLRLLQAPLALAILWGCESLLRRARRRKASRIFVISYHVLLWAIVGWISWPLIERLQIPVFAP